MRYSILGALALAGTLLLADPAFAGGCPAHYVDGRLPEIGNPRLAAATTELCFGVFGVMHSGVTRTPLWSAEHLTADHVAAAHMLPRENSFHAETKLPPGQRAELSDYAHSGYDRGHMTPNGDMPDPQSQHDSFTLANMVPQDANNNRKIWAGVESTVRKLVRREGDLYVITGPAYLGASVQQVGHVLVPTHLYKVVYSPREQAGGAYFVENKATEQVQVMTIRQLEETVGINLLPSLSAQQKQTLLPLPSVHLAHRRASQGAHDD